MPDPVTNPNPQPTTNDGKPAGTSAEKPLDATNGWLPEPLRTNKTLTKFKDAGELANAYVNLEVAHGKRFEENLGENAPADIKARVRASMGVPDSADGYDKPTVPEGATLDDGMFNGFRGVAHKLGISKSQAKGLSEWFIGLEQDRMSGYMTEATKAKEEGMKALNAKWGAGAPRMVGLAQRVVMEFGGADVKAALDETGAGNDPRILGWLARMGEAMAEGGIVDPSVVNTSVDEAKAKIAEIKSAAMKDRKHPYVNKSHPGHKAAIDEMNRLHEIVYAEA